MAVKDVKAKAMKVGAYEKLDEALYIWFCQQREKNVPVTGVLLQEKARLLYERLYPDTTPFVASIGFRSRFIKRHNLRCVSIQGEQVSAYITSACEFQHDFNSVMKDYELEQVVNCDETGLQFHLLPHKTLAHGMERTAEGTKKSKDRVTVGACANITGNIKLPLLFIGKAARPRCFSRVDIRNLPVVYKSQKNAWVNTNTFSEWLHNYFVPHVQEKPRELGKEPCALLVLDNCSAHPDQDLLISQDGKVKASFLSPNVTSLIQPMDQGVLKSLKRHYRKSLLQDILLTEEDLDICEFLKGVNMKTVIDKIVIAWKEISIDTICKPWRKRVPLPALKSSLTTKQSPPVSALQNDFLEAAEFLADFQQMGQSLTEQDVEVRPQ